MLDLREYYLGCSFVKFYDFRAVTFIHKLILTKCPEYLYSKLLISESTRTRRLITPRNRTAFYNDASFVRGIRAYNALPDNIKVLETLNSFRQECLRIYNF